MPLNSHPKPQALTQVDGEGLEPVVRRVQQLLGLVRVFRGHNFIPEHAGLYIFCSEINPATIKVVDPGGVDPKTREKNLS